MLKTFKNIALITATCLCLPVFAKSTLYSVEIPSKEPVVVEKLKSLYNCTLIPKVNKDSFHRQLICNKEGKQLSVILLSLDAGKYDVAIPTTVALRAAALKDSDYEYWKNELMGAYKDRTPTIRKTDKFTEYTFDFSKGHETIIRDSEQRKSISIMMHKRPEKK